MRILPCFPSVIVGHPIERANAFVYPYYVAQLDLFNPFRLEAVLVSCRYPAETKGRGDKSETRRPEVPLNCKPIRSPPIYSW